MVRTKAPKGDEAFKLVLDEDETELRLQLAPGTASGFYGVKKARKMWQATIYVSGKAVPQRDLGSFTRAIDAAVAVARAKRGVLDQRLLLLEWQREEVADAGWRRVDRLPAQPPVAQVYSE